VQGEREAHRLEVIDGLRGIAILVVVFYHAWLVTGQRLEFQVGGVTFSLQFLATTGFLGVDLFFFLSGFCLFYPYARRHFERREPQSLAEYARRRALKIVPSYVVALTIFTLPFHNHFDSLSAAAGNYFAHLFFIHPWFVQTFDSISGPFWTLGVEVQFYLVFPAIAYVMRSWPLRGYLAILVVAEAYRLVLIATHQDVAFYPVNQLPAFLDIFVGGMVAAYAVVWARMNIPNLARYRRALTLAAIATFVAAGVGLAALASSPALQSQDAFFQWQSRFRPAIALLLIVLAVSSVLAADRWRRTLANPLFVFLSAISYNLYLWHLEIFVWSRGVSADQRIVLAISITTAILTATFFTYALEQPILNGTWRTDKQRAYLQWLRLSRRCSVSWREDIAPRLGIARDDAARAARFIARSARK
jgi:peptidoglycan/LPS O-acetylase OafA/YrhL